MKKIFAVVLALVLSLAMFCASAETVSFAFAAVVDTEGNPIETDTSEIENSIITLDDEAYTITVGVADDPDGSETINGTIETEETEDGVAIAASLETEVELALLYAVTDDGVRTLTLIQENGMLVIFTEV